jgi:hypothetical protein
MRFRFFITMCLLGGTGGFLGSVAGAFFGPRALFIGGFIGGILIAPMSAKLALLRRWIAPPQYWTTALGAALGFITAAIVAVNTLSSPVGPVLSSALIGVGALVGSRLREEAPARSSGAAP